MPVPANRRHIFAPQDHWEAFQAAAESAGKSTSEWIGEACLDKLPKKIRAQLSVRQGPGKPAGTNSEKS